ncbi:hypothetical protein AB5I41_16465 [Sphingomonas sp. MMS24-JH45]
MTVNSAARLVAACGGGGGAGVNSGGSPRRRLTAPHRRLLRPPPSPSPTSAEYDRSLAAKGMKAQAADDAGMIGKGVTVAIIDTGIDVDGAEFKRLSSTAPRSSRRLLAAAPGPPRRSGSTSTTSPGMDRTPPRSPPPRATAAACMASHPTRPAGCRPRPMRLSEEADTMPALLGAAARSSRC